MKFTKYHGCGNDFIVTNKKDIDDKINQSGCNYDKIARLICHRNTGIGADGLIIVNVKPEEGIPVEMIIYNSDGSLAPMCGNGIRCFSQYCYDEGIVTDRKYSVKTGAGILEVDVKDTDPFMVEIDMGKPIFDPKVSSIDTNLPEFINQKIPIADITGFDGEPDEELSVNVSTFFMGTVHTVIWEDEMKGKAVIGIDEGELISINPIFKEKTNVNYVSIVDRNTIKLRTYERGAGYTLACGTGACASVVLGIRENKLNNRVKVVLPLGELIITQNENGSVFMQGPSEKIGEGTFTKQITVF